ncbi:hypothetical protein [Conexibacter sp. CPCC 206217]|uniref:hypothetical protein n=1 Tax=Conexibacter sp. CPCC 206217 TaxID=3064574 RepID=UPI0027213F93|nr:hypothetical protein [Conexibacter sp. CPCC 206217]MDO8213537.1 hypothetical protein [Conexibacter sp. CPCC 206217]
MSVAQAIVTVLVALGGIGLGALLSRHNERRSHADRLLVDALNDLVSAVAEVANGGGLDAQARYASAAARIALHAPGEVVEAFRAFQVNATTGTADGRSRFLHALQTARRATGADDVTNDQLAALIFGPPRPLREAVRPMTAHHLAPRGT